MVGLDLTPISDEELKRVARQEYLDRWVPVNTIDLMLLPGCPVKYEIETSQFHIVSPCHRKAGHLGKHCHLDYGVTAFIW